MSFSHGYVCRQFVVAVLIPLVTCCSHAQRSGQPILVANDVVDGPTGGAHRVEILTVFSNGAVTYSVQTKAHKSFTGKLRPADLDGLTNLLNSPEIQKLPNDLAAKTQPVDFFWDQTLKIVRGDGTQAVNIQRFYPFLNLSGIVYPQKLIELECKLKDIKTFASGERKDVGDWCKEILAQNFPEGESYKCSDDDAQTQVEGGIGWGPVRVGASFQSVERALGKGTPSEVFADVRFFEYRPRGIEVSFERTSNKVHAIYFYNHQRGSEQFGLFCGQATKGINWNSTIEDVRNAYGHPSADFIQVNSGRLQYSGIDFRFENSKLVRIGVPGR